jgi:hypothetical protein
MASLVPNRLSPRDRRVLGVGQEDQRNQEQGCHEARGRWATGHPRPEQTGRDQSECLRGIDALAADESFGLEALIAERGVIVVGRVVDRRGRAGRLGEGDRQRQGACNPVTEMCFGVDGQRGLSDCRPGVRREGREDDEPENDDRDRQRREELERNEPRDRKQGNLRSGNSHDGEPGSTDDPPQPQSTALRPQAAADLLEVRVERPTQDQTRIDGYDGPVRWPRPARPTNSD